jgi:hypothetical protein
VESRQVTNNKSIESLFDEALLRVPSIVVETTNVFLCKVARTYILQLNQRMLVFSTLFVIVMVAYAIVRKQLDVVQVVMVETLIISLSNETRLSSFILLGLLTVSKTNLRPGRSCISTLSICRLKVSRKEKTAG